jgi:hypothetical protein
VTTAVAIEKAPARPAARWIVGPTTDVAWFILPVVTGYLCLYVNIAFGVSSFFIWWFWNVFTNGPHFYATISRTYLDREEWRRRGALLVGSLGWFLVGPAAIAVTIATGSMGPFLVFWFFQVLWAYYHVSRQHWGFVALYQKLNGKPEDGANRADYWTFHLLMFLPVVSWFIRYPELRDVAGWGATPSAIERLVLGLTGPLVAATVAVYLLKEGLRFRRDGTFNLPKTLVFAAYVPLHLLLLLSPSIAGRYDMFLFQATITLPHNLQYLAIVWFYNTNRYGPARDARVYGWATVANGSVWRFTALAALFSVAVFYTRWYFEGRWVPLSIGRFGWSQVPIGQSLRVSDLVVAVWIGVVFNHQYLDQKIWRISRDDQLNEDLRLPAADRA